MSLDMITASPPHINTVSAYIPLCLPESASVHCLLHDRLLHV